VFADVPGRRAAARDGEHDDTKCEHRYPMNSNTNASTAILPDKPIDLSGSN
jgi:hypothetical protein